MTFLIDPKWNQNELNLHKERYELKVIMDRCYRDDPVYYQKLAKRYHEINKILGDDDYNCWGAQRMRGISEKDLREMLKDQA